MNQEELIKAVGRDSGITKAVVRSVLDCTNNVIVRSLANEESVKLFSGVTFEAKNVPAHEAVNPATQKPIMIADRIKCNVKLSETFKDRVNGR